MYLELSQRHDRVDPHSSRYTFVCLEYLLFDATVCGDTHRFSIGSVEDKPVLGNQAWLGCPLDLQGLAGWYRPTQQGRTVQGHSLRGALRTFCVCVCAVVVY